MWFLWFLWFLVGVGAHMPKFGDCHIDTVKSWGVYAKVNNSYSCMLDVPAGENVSFSVSLPASYTDPYDLSITLFGHGAADIECDPDFGGWGETPAWRRLDAGIDSTKTIPVQNQTELVFEPFGVGGYRAVAACQGRADIGDLFNLTVRNLRDGVVPISIGVGVVESFNALEVFLMSFYIAQTWSWSGSHFYIMSLFVTVLLYIVVQAWDARERAWTSRSVVIHLVRCGLIVNSVQFACQIMYLYSLGVPAYDWFPWVVHVALPLVVCILYSCSPWTISGWRWAVWVVFLVYTYAALWQGYCVPFAMVLFIMARNLARTLAPP